MNKVSVPFFSPSTYIIDQNPYKYGGQQENYKAVANEAIGLGLKKLQGCPKTEDKLTALFFEILEDFGKVRRSIALSHQTYHAEQFGKRRDIDGECDHYHTFLEEVYEGYNKIFLARIAELLKPYKMDKKDHPKIKVALESSYEDCKSSFEIEILEGQDPQILVWNSHHDLPADFPSHLIKKREKNKGLETHDKELLRRGCEKLKKENPEKYKIYKMQTLFLKLQKEFPSPKPIFDKNGKLLRLEGVEGNLRSFYALATARFLVNGKMYASSQYLIWLYRDFQNHPLTRMQQETKVMTIHMDNFLISDSLKEVAKRFVQSVMSNDEKLDDLKRHVGLFRFYLAPTMPWERGSASCGDMFETMVYRFHKYQVTYNNKKMVDLEASTTPLVEEFMGNYDLMIHLERLTQ